MSDNAAEGQTAARRQQEFHEELLAHQPSDPSRDLQHICDSWQKASGADWAWLWLYNENSSTFELTTCTTRK